MEKEHAEKRLNWQQACKLLGCSKSQFYRLVNNGELPAYRLGRRHLWVRETDCRKLLQPISYCPESEANQ